MHTSAKFSVFAFFRCAFSAKCFLYNFWNYKIQPRRPQTQDFATPPIFITSFKGLFFPNTNFQLNGLPAEISSEEAYTDKQLCKLCQEYIDVLNQWRHIWQCHVKKPILTCRVCRKYSLYYPGAAGTVVRFPCKVSNVVVIVP